jgi:hypothetical protein
MAPPDVVAINYSRDVGWSGALIAELCSEEPSTVGLTFNYDGGAEIGVWEQRLPAATFAQALALVQRSGYRGLASPDESPPEAKFIAIGERQRGQPLPFLRAFELVMVPPPVSALGAELEKLAVEPIRRHPLRVIHGGAGWARPVFAAGELLEIEVVLGNSGTLPLDMGNPLDAAAQGWSGMRLVMIDAVGHEQASDLTLANLRPPVGASTDATMTLDPGKALPFQVHKKVYLTPGRYSGRLEYHGLISNPGNRQLVTGVLWLELGTLEIRRGLRL